ncbi:hypothetical protein [Wolbachia endosymbiont of Atemnus politus]|uniref:hypothetical protein n=1 Tax=Wolbachia endosymbiont of Atemnus politus TaxID=2682840 RepID=UPI001FEB73C4|nr:hypothetical protein [Wolbachia endosymbiont of Atemnus politus]
MSILTPYELSKLLGLELAVSETIILFYSFRNEPEAVFNTKETKEFYSLYYLYLNSPRVFLYFASTFIVVLLCVFASTSSFC